MNKHERDQFYKQVILDCTDHEYLRECGYRDLRDAQQHERPRMGRSESHQDAMQEWLMGLPSACTIPFYNYEIIKMAVHTGLLGESHTERQADKVCEDYWRVMAAKVMQICDGYRVPKGE